MSKKYLRALLLCLFAYTGTFSFAIASASEHIDVISSEPFAVETQVIRSDVNKKEKNFIVRTISQDKNIFFWKVRFFCDTGVTIKLNKFEGDVCGRAVNLSYADVQEFAFTTLKTKRGTLSQFSFKIKGYDIADKWLYTKENIYRIK